MLQYFGALAGRTAAGAGADKFRLLGTLFADAGDDPDDRQRHQHEVDEQRDDQASDAE